MAEERKNPLVRLDYIGMGLLYFVGFVLVAYLLDPTEVISVKNGELFKIWMTMIQIALSALIIILGIVGVWLYDRLTNTEGKIQQLQAGHLELRDRIDDLKKGGTI